MSVYIVLANAEMDPEHGWTGFVAGAWSSEERAQSVAEQLRVDGLSGGGATRAIVLEAEVDGKEEGNPLGEAAYGSAFTEAAAREWEERERYRRAPWRAHPNADRARARLAAAIARGDIPPAKARRCQDCGHAWELGGPRHEYHHHRGYEPKYALDVIALCSPCHARRERERRAEIERGEGR